MVRYYAERFGRVIPEPADLPSQPPRNMVDSMAFYNRVLVDQGRFREDGTGIEKVEPL